ncbi:MAG: protein translocase subunit SecD [Verrucomicrobiota bacterium]
MKKSLIWRSIIIVVILAAWIYSMFPLHDQDFFDVFQEMADGRLSDYQETVEDARAELDEVEEKLNQLEQENGTEHEELVARKEELTEKLETNQERVERFDALVAEARQLLEEDKDIDAPYRALERAAEGDPGEEPVTLHEYIALPTNPQASNSAILSRVRENAKGTLRLGLDLRGGTEFILGFDEDDISEDDTPEKVRDQIINIISNRVDGLGLAEAQIKPIGPSSISLRMPSVTASEKADVRRTIQQTAKLTFHLVHPQNEQKLQEYDSNPDDFSISPEYKGEPNRMKMEEPGGAVEYRRLFITKSPARVSGEHIRRASASVDEFQNYYVSLTFNSTGAEQFADVTSENTGRQLAIVLDNKIYSAPQINEAITGGQAQITGDFSADEANRLASVIESGNLPVSIHIDSEFSIDPTLGRDSIRSGALATIIGLLSVLVFMIAYYRFAGVVAVCALIANIVLVFGTLALTGATLTLPGIAGLVLVIGMSVDANVLIYERIREERNNGKSLRNALHAGYRRAFVTILDANITTLITAFVLLRLGSGPIKGFAVTLSIGVIASMFTALFMTRVFFDLMLYRGWLKRLSMLLIVKNPTYDFLRVRKIAATCSVVLIVVAVAWSGFRGSDIWSIDFRGGTAITYSVDKSEEPPIGDVRGMLEEENLSDADVGYKYNAGAERNILEIILPAEADEPDEEGLTLDENDIKDKLAEHFPDAQFELVQSNSIGSLVGERFRNSAIWACLMAAIAIIIYISFRFEFAYGIASVVALVHDVLIAAGVYLLFGREISLPVVAALLTIMGYSLNDTIVLFDRVRENLGLLTTKTYKEIINLSINQVLSRTLLTSLTTLLVVLILFLFGGSAINDFALIILLGVIAGTYSSVFIAGNFIAAWHNPTPADKRESS